MGKDHRHQRLRGATLQAARLALLQRQGPLCKWCLAKSPPITRLWSERDHITPLHKGGAESVENTQGLCRECHDVKTVLERGDQLRLKRLTGIDGYPLIAASE